MNYFLFIIHLLLVMWMISRVKWMQVPGIKPVWTSYYFALKCFIGLALGYIYRFYYGFGDTINYVKDADALFEIFRKNPSYFLHIFTGIGGDPKILDVYRHQLILWYDSGFDSYYNDSRTIIRVNTLIRIFSFGYYEVHVVWMNFLAFLGLTWLYKAFANINIPNFSPSLIFIFPFFLPNVLVWGSGVLKEPVLLFVLGALLLIFQSVMNKPTTANILKLIIVSFVFLFIKMYLLLILIPGLIAWYCVKKNEKTSPLLIFTITYSLFLGAILIAGEWYPPLSLPSLLYGKQLNMYRFAVFSGSGSIVDPIMLAPTTASFLKRLPEAIGFCMFRPFFWELKQWWMIPLALENLVFPIIIVVLIMKSSWNSVIRSPLSLLALFAALGLFALVGFTSPVLGNLVRYKMPAILLLMLAFCGTAKKIQIKKSD
ncbi:hypothetical protein BH11BAC2_BH11BAC2_24560 [soil metagenome]